MGWNVSMLQIDIQILLTSVITNDRNRSSVRMELHKPWVSQLTADNAVVINKSFVNHTEPFENRVLIDRPKLACSTTSSSYDAMTNSNVVHNSKPSNIYPPYKRGSCITQNQRNIHNSHGLGLSSYKYRQALWGSFGPRHSTTK